MDTSEWVHSTPQHDLRKLLTGTGAPFQGMAIDHIGIAVRDITEAAERYGALFGAAWSYTAFESDAEVHGIPEVVRGKFAYAELGPIAIELVQPLGGTWTAARYLDECGEGAYHLGLQVPDVASAIAAAEAEGLRVDTVLTHPTGPLMAYLNRKDLHGMSVELTGLKFPAASFAGSFSLDT